MAIYPRLSCSIAAALLLAAGGAAASDAPLQCTTSGGSWIVTVTAPFYDVTNCPVESCTGMTYNLTPTHGDIPDHVAVTVEHDAPIVIPPSTFDTAPCAGDNVTGLAFRDCSRQTARINQNLQKVGPFDLVVQGTKKAESGSIVVKKGKVIEQCGIAALGLPSDIDPHQQVATTQTYTFKGCKLTIPVDANTGVPGDATLEGQSCKFVANNEDVTALSVSVNGASIGSGTWASDGGFSTGQNSCTNRIVSGRLYTICDCKTIPPDPRPPC